ncbi:718_t:CDS:1 [Paraglomus brasilianum]|uniref:718_t:CDS:1 n=1 Tax=Paraglomus brasilianum TaxID=144538 RepID=A0A9N8ZCF6_9GLOM|nr:718_t:CDS:1 [Paraglomus brasilianum]
MSTYNAVTTTFSNVGSFNDQSNDSIFQSACYTSCLTHSELSLLTAPPYILTLPIDTLLNPIPKHRRTRFKKDLPPRPQNSWVIFRKDFESQLRAQHPNAMYTLHEISAIAGVHWKNQPSNVKQYFRVLAKLALYQHNIMYPDYTYQPRKSRHARRPRRSKALFKNLNKDAFMDHSSSSSENVCEESRRSIDQYNPDYESECVYQANELDVEQYPDLLLETDDGRLYTRDTDGDFIISDDKPTHTWFESDSGATGLYCTYFIQQNIQNIQTIQNIQNIQQNISIDLFHPYY